MERKQTGKQREACKWTGQGCAECKLIKRRIVVETSDISEISALEREAASGKQAEKQVFVRKEEGAPMKKSEDKALFGCGIAELILFGCAQANVFWDFIWLLFEAGRSYESQWVTPVCDMILFGLLCKIAAALALGVSGMASVLSSWEKRIKNLRGLFIFTLIGAVVCGAGVLAYILAAGFLVDFRLFPWDYPVILAGIAAVVISVISAVRTNRRCREAALRSGEGEAGPIR